MKLETIPINIQYIYTICIKFIYDQQDILIYYAYFWGGLNMTHKQTDSLTNRKGNKDKAQISAGYSQNHPKHAHEKLCSSFYIQTKWSYTTRKKPLVWVPLQLKYISMLYTFVYFLIMVCIS